MAPGVDDETFIDTTAAGKGLSSWYGISTPISRKYYIFGTSITVFGTPSNKLGRPDLGVHGIGSHQGLFSTRDTKVEDSKLLPPNISVSHFELL